MKQVLATVALLGLSSTWDWAAAQNTGQQDEGFLLDEKEEPLVAPPEVVRVVGQAQTKEEYDDWTAIDQTEELQQKAELAMDFLENHPKSGLTPLAHQLLALFFQQQNEYERFVDHGEKAIAELPTSYVLLIELAVGYAERSEVQKALARAQQGLDGAAAAERPGQLSLVEWTRQKERLEADAHYALGLSNLHQSMKSSSTKTQHLDSCVEHFSKVVELEPDHDRAYLRMGRAYLGKRNAEKALEAYARAAATGGMTAEIAREQLSQLYTFVHKKTEGIEELIEQQREYLTQQKAAREAALQELQNQEMQQFILPEVGETPQTQTP
jgi:tetratricopeptide (TPR) repeat protein